MAHTRIPDRSSELLGNCLIRAEYRNGKNPSISVTFEQSDYYDRVLAGDNCPCVPNQPEMPHARLLSALTMTRRPYGGCQTPLDSVVRRAPTGGPFHA